MEPMNPTIIGEFLAIGVGLYIDNRSSDKRIQQAKEYLLSGINDDLRRSIEICRIIENEWEQKERVARATLNDLKRCALTYRHNQELIALIYEHARGEHIFKYFHEIIEIVAAMEHDQGCINDIEEAFSDKLRRLKQSTPDISDEEAVNSVVYALNQEQKRYYAGLRKGMTSSIKRLTELTRTATELDQDIQAI